MSARHLQFENLIYLLKDLIVYRNLRKVRKFTIFFFQIMCKTMPITSTASSSSSPDSGNFSNNMEEQHSNIEEQMNTLEEKMKRTSKFLQEIQKLSPACEEVQEEMKERQVGKNLLCLNKRCKDRQWSLFRF